MHDFDHHSNLARLKHNYRSLLKTDNEHFAFFAPGRVNIIGEYTDFNGGFVLPCAIQNGTYLIVQTRADQEFHFHSMNCPETVTLSINTLRSIKNKQAHYAWANYPLAVVKQFENELNSGFDFFYYGNIPLGSGLSSSASIEMLTAFALNTLLNTKHSLTELALLCQRAENRFIGVQCGIMDMYSIAHGKNAQAMMINCEKMQHTDTTLTMNVYSWLIINSNKKRQLSESKYNERFQECQAALRILNLTRNLDNLCQLPFEQLKQAQREITDPLIFKRLHHVVSEHQRVLACQAAMQKQDWQTVATLMNASHQSLSEDFEVSGDILDTLVSISQQTPSVLAARMTGAGFGGCVILLIVKAQEASIIKNIEENYFIQTNLHADFFPALASHGVQQLPQESSPERR